MSNTDNPNRPNLVFVFSDRQRFDTMSCYGNDWINTPNLNAMGDESFVFDNCYVTQAVCAPARSSILTGLFPHKTGVPTNKLNMYSNIKTIAEMLPEEYTKGYFGKWHLGDEVIPQHGFTEWRSVMEEYYEGYTNSDYMSLDTNYHEFLLEQGFKPDLDSPAGKLFSDDFRANLPKEFQIASYLANEASKFIKSNNENPFVLYVSFLEPHPPFSGPFDTQYDPDELPVDETFLKYPKGHSLFSRLRAEFFMKQKFSMASEKSEEEQWNEFRNTYHKNTHFVGHDVSDEQGWRKLRSGYMSNISLVDDAVGKISSSIDEAGLRDNTIFIFTSEHGDMVGSHGMLEMRTFYEYAAKVPMLMRVPWLQTDQTRIGGNFSQIDLVPTLMDLMNCKVPEELHGTSRKTNLATKTDLTGNDVFMQHNGIEDRDLGNPMINLLNTRPWRSIVTEDRWKLNLCASDQCELFDLNNDPYEQTNLFNDPNNKDRIRIMTAKILEWQKSVDDSAAIPTT
ncbi:MAG: hypothetical protein CL733_02725 [Chloroflexi bacterium]|nr:hypothetical protein [Chloroflexota bacterium]|tara:strand:+ start:946 stop:2469 length:1524 start_codon:yes stop_codon:yes gene_type:complete